MIVSTWISCSLVISLSHLMCSQSAPAGSNRVVAGLTQLAVPWHAALQAATDVEGQYAGSIAALSAEDVIL